MKASSDFVLRNVAGEYILMPKGAAIGSFGGVVLLNSLSAFIWEKLQKNVTRDELLAQILANYEVDEETASADLDASLAQFREMQLLEE